MQIRYTPRQGGLYGGKAISGHGEDWETQNLVTDAEVNRVNDSETGTHERNKGDMSQLPQGEPFRSDAHELLKKYSLAEREEDKRVIFRAATEAAKADASAPTEYPHEVRAKSLLSRISDAIFSGNRLKKGQIKSDGGEKGASDAEENRELGTDADGNILFKEDICAYIIDELDRRKRERLPLELQWQLNGNFYDGNQFCDINPAANEVMQYPLMEGEPRGEVFNRIAPLIETRVANLKKIDYAMIVKPATNEADDCQKAKVSTAILRAAQKNSDFNSKKDALILWNELCGSCFWLTWWDTQKGEVAAVIEEEIEDAESGEVSAKERYIYEGDVDYGLITPYEIYPESVFKQTVGDQQSIIVEQIRTVDEIESLYGIRTEGEEVDAFTLVPAPGAGGYGYEATVITMGKAKRKNCQRVITYFERRSKAFPEGRMAVMIGESELVYYGKMPYDDIPIVRCVCKERPGQFFGKSVIEELIPLQRSYNTVCNDITEYIKTLKEPQIIAYEGSIDTEDYEENAGRPNAILSYRGDPEYPPIWRQSVAFSGDIFTLKYDLEKQMEYVAAVSQLMVYGQTPSGVTSGTAIESLREIDNTRLALTGDYIRDSVLSLARLWLDLYKRYATTYRVTRFVGKNNIGSSLVWSRDDITCYDIEFTAENELMSSEDGQWERIVQLLNAGITDQKLMSELSEKVRDYIKSGGYNSEMSLNELQTQAAVRENVLLSSGVLPAVRDYDDHSIHATEHLKFMLQADYEEIKREKPNLAGVMLEHYNMHISAIQQKAAEQAAQQQAAQQQAKEG